MASLQVVPREVPARMQETNKIDNCRLSSELPFQFLQPKTCKSSCMCARDIVNDECPKESKKIRVQTRSRL